MGYKGLQGLTNGYNGLRTGTKDYKGLQRVTRGFKGLQRGNLIQAGGGGLFEPPLRQNRDNSNTERAMTFKFSDFS